MFSVTYSQTCSKLFQKLFFQVRRSLPQR